MRILCDTHTHTHTHTHIYIQLYIYIYTMHIQYPPRPSATSRTKTRVPASQVYSKRCPLQHPSLDSSILYSISACRGPLPVRMCISVWGSPYMVTEIKPGRVSFVRIREYGCEQRNAEGNQGDNLQSNPLNHYPPHSLTHSLTH